MSPTPGTHRPEHRRWWRRLRRNYDTLAEQRPGRRFQHFHFTKSGGQPRMSAPLQITLGVLVMVSGIIISLPPGIPGFFITLAGLGIIAARSHRVARALDRTELGARRWWRRLRDSHRKP